MSEATDGAPDQLWAGFEETMRVYASPFQRAQFEIVDDDISLGSELGNYSAITGTVEVKSDAFLVPVYREEIRALAAGVERRTPRTGVISAIRALYLYYVRTKIA
jgi:hypothetical protein